MFLVSSLVMLVSNCLKFPELMFLFYSCIAILLCCGCHRATSAGTLHLLFF